MQSPAALAVLAACVAAVAAVDFRTCDSSRTLHGKASDFAVDSCAPTAKECRLRRTTEVKLELKFTPEGDTGKLSNRVYARLLGVPFPFIGVDGTPACESIFNADGSKGACPLKAGQTYIYKNSFKVLDIYPKVRVDVHWALQDAAGKDVLCFEVPARIVNAPKSKPQS